MSAPVASEAPRSTGLARRGFLLAALGAPVALGVAPALGGCSTASRTVELDWTRLPDGPAPDRSGDGRDVRYFLGDGALRRPTVRNGLQGELPDARAATYVSVQAPAPVTEIGASFRFSGPDPRGSVCLVPWPAWPPPTTAAIPDTTCHLVITPAGYEYGMWRDRQLTVVASGSFPSVADASTELTARVVRDGETARVELPHGAGISVPLGLGGAFGAVPCWEFFKLAPGGADVTFTRTWARW